jgi:hypothetical protein
MAHRCPQTSLIHPHPIEGIPYSRYIQKVILNTSETGSPRSLLIGMSRAGKASI